MLSKKIQKIKPSPTLALAAKSKELSAQGHDVISLAVGEPDWDTFQVAKKEAIRAIEEGFTKYVPSNGIEELRKIISESASKEYKVSYTPNQVTVTAGGKFTIFSALQSILDPGDEVIIPAPYWVSYPTMVEMTEGIPIIVECGGESNYKMTAHQLEKAVSKNTKLVILCSPSNPTGAMYSEDEYKKLAKVLLQHPQVMIMSDDIYNKLVFDSSISVAPHILHVAPELKDRVININGAAKSFSMTGWRVGWALAQPSVISAMTNYQSQTVSCAVSFAQKAVAKAILEGGHELTEARKKLVNRKTFAVNEINKLKIISSNDPDGAFYLWVNVKKIFGKILDDKKIMNSSDFSKYLLEDQKVTVVPGVEFGSEGYVRMSFAIENARMKEAVDRIRVFLSKLK